VLIADRLTKAWVVDSFFPHEVRRVFGDWARLTYIHNPGAAFGLFPGSRPALIAISCTAVLVVTVVAWRRRDGILGALPLGLILGGAIGNLVDRVRLGEVVDFVQLGIPPNMYWPVFNVADAAVSIGVVWLAFGLLKGGKPAEEAIPSEEPVANVASSSDER
jgi:signal peptidase II